MSTPAGAWDALELLAEPTRRRVYDAVRAADEPLRREEVAEATGVNLRLATFHLDRLAEAGLLDVDFARPAGRAGPGAGRPAKRYRPAPIDLEIAVPPRRYNVMARVLAAAVARTPADAATTAAAIAREEGRRLGEAHRPARARSAAATLGAACAALTDLGYEPVSEDSRIRLRNCPFHDAVDVAPGLVCGLNVEVVSGVLEGVDAASRCSAVLDGVAPDCCVTVRTSKQAAARR